MEDWYTLDDGLGTTELTPRIRPMHGVLAGAIIGLLIVATAVVVMATGYDVDITSAVALGIFVGFWGGAGLGGLLGATVAELAGFKGRSAGR